MKPRIRRAAIEMHGLLGCSTCQVRCWVCSSPEWNGRDGIGASPKDAYDTWLRMGRQR
jgi:hypothetical protein